MNWLATGFVVCIKLYLANITLGIDKIRPIMSESRRPNRVVLAVDSFVFCLDMMGLRKWYHNCQNKSVLELRLCQPKPTSRRLICKRTYSSLFRSSSFKGIMEDGILCFSTPFELVVFALQWSVSDPELEFEDEHETKLVSLLLMVTSKGSQFSSKWSKSSSPSNIVIESEAERPHWILLRMLRNESCLLNLLIFTLAMISTEYKISARKKIQGWCKPLLLISRMTW